MSASCSQETVEPSKQERQEFLLPDNRRYIEWQLSSYGLQQLKEEAAIRFLWMRSFHPAIVFDLRKKGEDELRYEARVWEKGKWRTFSQQVILAEDSNLVSILELELSGFFEAPHFTIEQFKIADGSTWILEAYSNNKYNWVLKSSPKEDTIEGRWARKLIEKSIDSPVVPIY